MPGLEGETHTSVVEEDPRLTGDEVGAEIKGVGLGERDPEPFGVDGAEVGGIAVR
jgi:hypothetical protein